MMTLHEAVFEMTRRRVEAGFPPLVDVECSRPESDVVICYFRFAGYFEWDTVGFIAPEPCDLEACEQAFRQADVRRTIH
jgi:hypothetical protein